MRVWKVIFLLRKNNINREVSMSITTNILHKNFTYPLVGEYSKMFRLFLRAVFRKHWYSKDMCGVKIYFLSSKWQNIFWIYLCNIYISHLPQQCQNSKCVIFQDRLLNVLKCYNFLWVPRRHNCSPATNLQTALWHYTC